MADRKEWELTDEERTEIRAWYCGQGSISLHSRNIFCLADAFAYKGARKALGWAAKKFEARALERTHSHCSYDSETNAYECSEVIEAMNEEDDNCAELLRKELTDG